VTLFDQDADALAAAVPGPRVRLRMTVAYRGTAFHGFTAQPRVRTVGGDLADALARVLRLPVPPPLTCAGRTDAGVHAWGQVVHVDVPATVADGPVAPADLQRRLVRLLSPAIVVRSLTVAPEGFDARRSARWRHYRYTVLNDTLPDPFLDGQVWLVRVPLDLRAMQLACDPLIGEHDFTSFCRRADPDESLVRRVLDARWVDLGDRKLRFDIQATSFCQQMVRSLVGTLVDVGAGRRRAGEMTATLRARDRTAAGPVAPPEGLCLWEVGYPDDGGVSP
jgi:tRNA pseudouridine38-40 synthase